jgi:hypothetical protein
MLSLYVYVDNWEGFINNLLIKLIKLFHKAYLIFSPRMFFFINVPCASIYKHHAVFEISETERASSQNIYIVTT